MGQEYSVEAKEDVALKGLGRTPCRYILGSWGDGIGGRDFRKGASSERCGREGKEVRRGGRDAPPVAIHRWIWSRKAVWAVRHAEHVVGKTWLPPQIPISLSLDAAEGMRE